MKQTGVFLLLMLLSGIVAHAQRGDIVIPTDAAISVPAGAQICADRIYANNPDYGTLTLANASCLCPGTAVIPVELLSFSALPVDNAVHLSWSTATETNCTGFEVQRSGDGELWFSLGFVPGHGSTTLGHVYIFEDPLNFFPLKDRLFYRLRVIDMDGAFEYSSTIEVRLGAEIIAPALTAIYPNPASDCITIRFALADETAVSLAIYSVSGTVVMRLRSHETMPRGFHLLQAPVNDLRSGSYMVEFTGGGVRLTERVMIMR